MTTVKRAQVNYILEFDRRFNRLVDGRDEIHLSELNELIETMATDHGIQAAIVADLGTAILGFNATNPRAFRNPHLHAADELRLLHGALQGDQGGSDLPDHLTERIARWRLDMLSRESIYAMQLRGFETDGDRLISRARYRHEGLRRQFASTSSGARHSILNAN